jgi:hypothetical protein
LQLPNVSRQLPAAELLHHWQGNRLHTHGDRTAEDQKMPLIIREFGLALKVLLSKVRTDNQSGGKADARQGTHADLSTIAAGVNNAGRKPLPAESQQPIRRGVSLWAL